MLAPSDKSRHVTVAIDVDRVEVPASIFFVFSLSAVSGRMSKFFQQVNTNCVLGHSHISGSQSAALVCGAAIPKVGKQRRIIRIDGVMNPNNMAVNSEC